MINWPHWQGDHSSVIGDLLWWSPLVISFGDLLWWSTGSRLLHHCQVDTVNLSVENFNHWTGLVETAFMLIRRSWPAYCHCLSSSHRGCTTHSQHNWPPLKEPAFREHRVQSSNYSVSGTHLHDHAFAHQEQVPASEARVLRADPVDDSQHSNRAPLLDLLSFQQFHQGLVILVDLRREQNLAHRPISIVFICFAPIS